MGTTSQKLTYLAGTKDKLKTTINYTGAGIDNTTTFRKYDEKLYNALASSLINNQTIFDNMPKVNGSGSSLTLNNTTESKMQLTYKGNTQQDGEPTPDSPQTIHSVSGDNVIEVCGKQFFRDEYIGTPGNTINAVLKKGTYTIATCDSNQMGTNIYFKLFDY